MKSRLSIRSPFLTILLILTISFSWSMTAVAMDLQHAKEMGMVGETQSGYLGIVNSAAPTDVKALVDDINNKRKSKYQEIAKSTGTSVSSVEMLAGEKAMARTPSGQYIMSPSGKWMKK